MWWFRSGKRVLTIGSVHLDTIALSRSDDPAEDVTHIGSITHSVGGSAYNIAANLTAHHGRQGAVSEAAVYSILPQHSVLTEIIKYKVLKSTGIRRTRKIIDCLPWSLLSRLVDFRYAVSAQPMGTVE